MSWMSGTWTWSQVYNGCEWSCLSEDVCCWFLCCCKSEHFGFFPNWLMRRNTQVFKTMSQIFKCKELILVWYIYYKFDLFFLMSFLSLMYFLWPDEVKFLISASFEHLSHITQILFSRKYKIYEIVIKHIFFWTFYMRFWHWQVVVWLVSGN